MENTQYCTELVISGYDIKYVRKTDIRHSNLVAVVAITHVTIIST